MVTAVLAFVGRVASTVSPAAYKRLDQGRTVAGLYARAFDRRAEDYQRNERLLRTKADRLKSAITHEGRGDDGDEWPWG